MYKDQYFVYSANKFQTGLTDVTARVRRNGVYVLGTDVTPLALTELDNGRYQLVLTAAQIVTAGGAGSFQIDVDSASKSAPATATRIITEHDEDDIITELAAIDAKIDIIDSVVDGIDTQLDTVEGKVDVIDANVDQALLDIAAAKAVVDDTNSVVKDGGFGNSALKALIDAVQSTVDNISNVTRFQGPVPKKLLRPDAGSKSYIVPLRIFDTNGNLEAPDGDLTVTVKNNAGTDRTADYINGATGTAHVIPPVSTGVYEMQIDIANTDPDEPLNFEFNYVENSLPQSQVTTSEIIPESADTAGLALEATAQSILSDTNAILIDTAAMQPQVADIQAQVNDAAYGLAALKALIDTVDSVVDSTNSEVTNVTYGLSAIKTALDGKATQASVDALAVTLASKASQSSVDAIAVTLASKSSQASVDAAQADLTAIKGAGFVEADHSLKAIGDSVYNGGVIA